MCDPPEMGIYFNDPSHNSGHFEVTKRRLKRRMMDDVGITLWLEVTKIDTCQIMPKQLKYNVLILIDTNNDEQKHTFKLQSLFSVFRK